MDRYWFTEERIMEANYLYAVFAKPKIPSFKTKNETQSTGRV
jgi:hypothetical protein